MRYHGALPAINRQMIHMENATTMMIGSWKKRQMSHIKAIRTQENLFTISLYFLQSETSSLCGHRVELSDQPHLQCSFPGTGRYSPKIKQIIKQTWL